MKHVIIAVAALMLLGSSAYGSESLSDALTKGKFNGEVKFLYLTGTDTDVLAAKPNDNRNTGSTAVEANYVTGDFYGFSLGGSVQAGWDLGFHDEDGSSEDDTRNSVTSANIFQAFAAYKYRGSSIRVGRQVMKSPLLMYSSVFPLKDSFDGAQFSTDLIPGTVVKGFYVNRWNKRYDSDSNGSVVQEDKEYSDGLYSLYIKNQSIKSLTLDGQYLTTNEDGNNGDIPVVTIGGYDDYFLQADYRLLLSFPLSVSAMLGGASFDRSSEADARFYGLKVGTAVAGVKLTAAYTSMDEDNDFPGALGSTPDVLLYTNGLMNKSFFAGVDAVSLEAKYDFGIKGFNARLKLIHHEQSDEGIANSVREIREANEADLDLKYAFSGVLEGFSIRLFMGYVDYNLDVDENTNAYARLHLNYAF